MDKKYCDIPKIDTDKTDIMAVPAKSVEGGVDFTDHLTETEREYYLDLVGIMQSPKFGMDREAAEREAGAMVTRNHHPLQIEQAVKDYRQYGYLKIFSTVLGEAVYLACDDRAAKRVPDRNIAVFLESDLEAVNGLSFEESKTLLEAKFLLGGRIMKTQASKAK